MALPPPDTMQLDVVSGGASVMSQVQGRCCNAQQAGTGELETGRLHQEALPERLVGVNSLQAEPVNSHQLGGCLLVRRLNSLVPSVR